MDHAAPHAPAAEEAREAPFLANAGFLISMIGLILVVTLKLAPAGFGLAVIGIVVSIAGAAQAAEQMRPVKLAIAGIVCSGVSIALWLLARDDITGIAGGRHFWPSWLF